MGLKEAALDSPTFRSGFTHFSEQLELVERWLDNYIKCIIKLSHEVGAFESLMTGFLSQTVPPTHVSEAVLDHDYTLLAMKRYGDCAKEFWTATISGLKRMETNMAEPIKAFLSMTSELSRMFGVIWSSHRRSLTTYNHGTLHKPRLKKPQRYERTHSRSMKHEKHT